MVRSAIVVAAACFAIHAELLRACDCDAHTLFNTSEELKHDEFGTTSCTAKTPEKAVDCVAKAADYKPTATFKAVVSASADMLSAIVQGKAPSQTTILKDVGAIAIAAIDMFDPILGTFASFLFSFFQGIFGGGDSSTKLYDMIMRDVRHLISESEIKQAMTHAQQEWQGYRSDIDNHPSRHVTDDYFYKEAPSVFQGCYSHGTGVDCKTWSEHGAAGFAIHFVANHLQTEIQIASYDVKDKKKVSEMCAQVKKWAPMYVKMLRAMISQFAHHRLATTTLNYRKDIYDGECRATLTDSYSNSAVHCNACSTCINGYACGKTPHFQKDKDWRAAWGHCMSSHNDKIKQVIDEWNSQVKAIENLGDHAAKHCSSAPTPGPRRRRSPAPPGPRRRRSPAPRPTPNRRRRRHSGAVQFFASNINGTVVV